MITLDGTSSVENVKSSAEFQELILSSGFNPAYPVLVVSDVDSTFIKQEVIDLLAARCGKGAEVAAITDRAMRGEIDFSESLRSRVATLAEHSVSILTEVRNQIEYSDGAVDLVNELRDLGHHFALVSGGFQQILEPICHELKIIHYLANRLEISKGLLTGKIDGKIVDADAKAEFLIKAQDQLGVSPSNVIAIGDGANDIPMMQAASISVSFNGKPKVQEIADIHISSARYDLIRALFV